MFLTAVPHGLRLDKEIREIEEAIRRAVRRERFEIIIKTAVRPQDIRRTIAEECPQIVHFCGHGYEDGSLLLEDDGGNNKPIPPEGLAALFELHADYVDCVLINACYSEKSAEAISQYINYVIGMNQPIGDRAAIAFAQGFYDGLGYEASDNQDVFQRAFDEGRVAIKLEHLAEGQIPVFKSQTNKANSANNLKKPMNSDLLSSKNIISLAFSIILEKNVNNFTDTALVKMDELRQKIWKKLQDNARAEKAFTAVEQGSKADLERLVIYLHDEMEDDQQFAAEVQALAHEINLGKLQDSNSMNQSNYDNAKGWQTKVDGGIAYIGEIHNLHNHSKP